MRQEIEQTVTALLEKDPDPEQLDLGNRAQLQPQQLTWEPNPDDRGLWIRGALGSSEAGHFLIPKSRYISAMEVYVAFDTFSMDVVWIEEGDREGMVYWSKYDYEDLQENYPELYTARDLKGLAAGVVGEQDIHDSFEGEADELRNNPKEYIPFVSQVVEL